MKIINPATEKIIATVEETSKEEIQQKYEQVKEGQKLWAKVPLRKRVEVLKRFQVLLSVHKDELAATMTAEVGKPLNQSAGEVNGARGRMQFYLDKSEQYLADEWMHQEEGLGEKIVYEPLGVIANISAWNYPYLVGVNVFVAALIAGNGVLYKPSEYATLTGLKIRDLLYEAGVQEDTFQIVVGAREAGEALLELPLDGYFFTGSYRTGKYIYEKVAPKMVPCQLELGGKDPMYITNDNIDIKGIAAAAVEGAFYNNGQSCCSVERIYVHQDVYHAFVEEFVREVKTLKMGSPTQEGVFLGTLTRGEQINVLNNQVKDAIDKGANLLCGGKRAEGKGFFYEPTVLTNTNHDMLLMHEESFGPIIGIQMVKDDTEAISLMKDTEYGLTSSVFTNTPERAEQILAEMDSGTAYWNCCDRVSSNLPWSGRGHSGFGATLSHQGIRAFVQPKAYHLRG